MSMNEFSMSGAEHIFHKFTNDELQAMAPADVMKYFLNSEGLTQRETLLPRLRTLFPDLPTNQLDSLVKEEVEGFEEMFE